MDEKKRKRIIEQETAAFLDPQFGQLDLSGFPGLQKPIKDEFEPADKHGLSNVDTSGLGVVNRLKELVRNPDREALSELARDNPEIAAQLQEERATEVARQFVASNPRYLQTDRNFERIVSYLLQKHLGQDLRVYEDADAASIALLSAGAWTVPTLTTAFKTLLHEGELDTASNEPRYLTAEEKLRCEQIAANGDILMAIGDYVQYRIGEDAADQVRFTLADPLSFTADPRNREILEEAVWFCWQAARPAFTPTPERIAAMKRHIAGRFVNVALLDAAWAAVQEAEKDAFRSGLLHGSTERSENGQQPEVMDFDSLSDEEIARLRTATLREYARQQRARG